VERWLLRDVLELWPALLVEADLVFFLDREEDALSPQDFEEDMDAIAVFLSVTANPNFLKVLS
jgi:hypothetical protein